MIDLFTCISVLKKLDEQCKELIKSEFAKGNKQEALRLQSKREGVKMSISTLERLKNKNIEIL